MRHACSRASFSRLPDRPVRLAIGAGVLLAVFACTDSLTGPGESAQKAFEPSTTMSTVLCQADLKAATLSCGETSDPLFSRHSVGIDLSKASPAEDIIIGGQNVNVKVTSSNIVNDVANRDFKFDVNVQNLRPQPIGTTNGTTTDSSLSVFFFSGPTTTGGSGNVFVANPTGIGTFTGANQVYFKYGQMLTQNAISPNKNWILHYDPGVSTFSFLVYVSANVKYPNGYIDVIPASGKVIGVGEAFQMTDSVRNALGVATDDQSETWSLNDPGKASIDAGGLLTGSSAGFVIVTAKQDQKTGSATVQVVNMQNLTGDPIFQTTTNNPATGEDEVHIHIKFAQSGTSLSLSPACGSGQCVMLARNQAGRDIIGPDTPGQLWVDLTSLTGTVNGAGQITFTITNANGRSFTFTGTASNSNTLTGTLSGTTQPAIAAVFIRV